MSRVLHRIFFNFDDGPDPFRSYLETWRRELPDFELKLWDKDNLPLDLNEYTRTLAAERNHAYLSDYFRCWLLKQYGGIYLDADIEILDGDVFRALYDEAQEAGTYSLFIGVESDGNGLLTAHSMGVKDGAGHELLDFLMGLYEGPFSGPLHYYIKNFDMPYLMALYFLRKEREEGFRGSEGGRFRNLREPIETCGMKIYPQVYFSPVTTRPGAGVDRTILKFGPETCLCHHFAATWREAEDGSKLGKLFAESLRSGEYSIPSHIRMALELRYGRAGVRAPRPTWRLTESEIAAAERVLNRLIPYGSFPYKLLKKVAKR